LLARKAFPFAVSPPAPNAQITVCSAPALGGNPCTNTVAIYTTAALSVQIPQPAQIGPSGSYTFFYSPAAIVVQITGRPDVIVPRSGGGGGSGTVSGQAANTIPVGSAATAVTTAVCTPPTANGTYTVGYTVSASVSVAPTCPINNPALGVSSVDGLAFTTVQGAMTAAGTNAISIVPPNYAGTDTPSGTRIVNLLNPNHSSIQWSASS
jgi:hypothetical protein